MIVAEELRFIVRVTDTSNHSHVYDVTTTGLTIERSLLATLRHRTSTLCSHVGCQTRVVRQIFLGL
jgi:hypothetical protein